MDEFDRKIAAALERDAAEQFEKMGADQTLVAMMVGGFRGRHLWINIIMVIKMLILLAACVYCTVRFFQADDLRAMMSWGFGSAVTFFAVAFLKLWFWLEMQRNATVREIKRVEIQIASLAGRMKA